MFCGSIPAKGLPGEGRGFLVDVLIIADLANVKDGILKEVYYDYYVKIYRPGMTVPSWLLETIRKWYKANEGEGNIKNFTERIIRMFF